MYYYVPVNEIATSRPTTPLEKNIMLMTSVGAFVGLLTITGGIFAFGTGPIGWIVLASVAAGAVAGIGTVIGLHFTKTLLSSLSNFKSSKKQAQALNLSDDNEVEQTIKNSLSHYFINSKDKVSIVAKSIGNDKAKKSIEQRVMDTSDPLYLALNKKRYGLGITFFGAKHWISFKSRSLQKAQVEAQRTMQLG